jgi:hypothetical protein
MEMGYILLDHFGAPNSVALYEPTSKKKDKIMLCLPPKLI